jgi:hypothetical protein
MNGIIHNNTKYIMLHNEHQLKFTSLEDNVYFTLRDIFLNTSQGNIDIEANEFNGELTNNIRYEDRFDTFRYTDKLKCKTFVKSLYSWINSINLLSDFEFDEDFDNEFDKNTESIVIDMKPHFTYYYMKNKDNYINFITFDSWLIHLNELKVLLNNIIENKSKTYLPTIIESIPTRDYHTDLLAVIEFCKLNGFYYEFIGDQESDFSEKYDYHNNNYDGYKRYVMQIDMICNKQMFTNATYTLLDRLQDIDQCMYNDSYEKVYGLYVDNNIEIDLIKELYKKCDEKKIEFNTKYWYDKM